MPDDVTLVPPDTSNVAPIRPEPKQIPAKLPEEDRAPLGELFFKMLAMQNAKAVFDAQIAQYKAQVDLAQTRINAIMQQGAEVEKKYNEVLAAIRERHGIPVHWAVDAETGTVAPPQSQMPAR
jgi:hypothetical protein